MYGAVLHIQFDIKPLPADTLIHYDVNAWEGKAYTYGLQYLQEIGCPVDGLQFDPTLVTRGLIADQELGNLIKVDRFG